MSRIVVVRQMIGNSKRRLTEKIKSIDDTLKDGDITHDNGTGYLIELEKKMDTFQRHMKELEAVSQEDCELERFIAEYDVLQVLAGQNVSVPQNVSH